MQDSILVFTTSEMNEVYVYESHWGKRGTRKNSVEDIKYKKKSCDQIKHEEIFSRRHVCALASANN